MSTIITSAGQSVTTRAIKVNPWARRAEAIEMPSREMPCGCAGADGLEMARLLGRRQTAYPVLDGEVLIVGVGVSGPRWWWGASLEIRGFGLILAYGHTLTDSRTLVPDVWGLIEWPRRQAAARAA